LYDVLPGRLSGLNAGANLGWFVVLVTVSSFADRGPRGATVGSPGRPFQDPQASSEILETTVLASKRERACVPIELRSLLLLMNGH
jgi:hypothetical protein